MGTYDEAVIEAFLENQLQLFPEKVAESFDRDFYVPNEELPQYQKLMKPYMQLKKKVDYLVENGKIGKATGESIKLRNGVKID